MNIFMSLFLKSAKYNLKTSRMHPEVVTNIMDFINVIICVRKKFAVEKNS